MYLLNLNNIKPEELIFWTKDFVAMFLMPVKVFQQIKLLVIFMKTKMIKDIYQIQFFTSRIKRNAAGYVADFIQ